MEAAWAGAVSGAVSAGGDSAEAISAGGDSSGTASAGGDSAGTGSEAAGSAGAASCGAASTGLSSVGLFSAGTSRSKPASEEAGSSGSVSGREAVSAVRFSPSAPASGMLSVTVLPSGALSSADVSAKRPIAGPSPGSRVIAGSIMEYVDMNTTIAIITASTFLHRRMNLCLLRNSSAIIIIRSISSSPCCVKREISRRYSVYIQNIIILYLFFAFPSRLICVICRYSSLS